MQLTINVPDQFVAEAKVRGIAPESYAEELLNGEMEKFANNHRRETVVAAVARIKDLRRGNRLNGVTIQELVREGRKY